MDFLSRYIDIIERELKIGSLSHNDPKELYEPMDYILNIGGKRLRPVMMLIACDIFGGNLEEAIKPALGIEYFHNFTLMHDDIMDQADKRRNKQTVHKKYNQNVAILSGDAMLIKSYQMFEDLELDIYKNIIRQFSKTAIEVCQGQQYDMNFENQKNVNFDSYIKMIEGKTACLCAASLKIGAMIAKAKIEDVENIYKFGINLGLAFQIMDDYLDVFGEEERVGKKSSGDIVENKKTILYILAMKNAKDQDRKILERCYQENSLPNDEKIDKIKTIFIKSQVDKKCQELIKEYSDIAVKYLDKICLSIDKKEKLYKLTDYLLKREF